MIFLNCCEFRYPCFGQRKNKREQDNLYTKEKIAPFGFTLPTKNRCLSCIAFLLQRPHVKGFNVMDSMHARYQRDIVFLKKKKVASVEFFKKTDERKTDEDYRLRA